MEKGLSGKKVVIAGSRKTDEMSTLIEKQGGIPILRPLQGTVYFDEKKLEKDFLSFLKKGADWTIFTTGMGIQTLIEVSLKLGVKDRFLSIIGNSSVASRGYKTFAALKKLEVVPRAVDDDGTNRGLVRSLENDDFHGKKVMVQLHGENAPTLISFLEKRGAEVMKLLPYQHIPPQKEIVDLLCQEISMNNIDAICFTTAIQVRSLFDYAREIGVLDSILDAFNEKVLAAAVGKVTAEALSEEGLENFLVPDNERMGAMIIGLSRYYSSQGNE
ncbi:uroporphyrinogen-III synthase [Bacillus massilinigeriensis]|uniref:uroporphyrinogen-III synthase n=1 Tax=Bacillus massilionigeriensis TaxID=1805475 RepID=UPI00096B25A7|nr:uroporphyrinogen-III synthase [Bacillus massilionigeriensis]